MKGTVRLRSAMIGAAVVGMGVLLTPTSAFAATTASTAASTAPSVRPDPTCKVPVFTVSPTSAKPGSKVTVSGVNFSGCSAQGNPAKPTAVLPVKIGVVSAGDKMGELLASTTTSATGSFSVTITVPAVPSGGVDKIAIAAASIDPATKLEYAGVAVIKYTPTTTTPTPTTSSTSAPSSSSTSSEPAPTAVPAGSGGQGASGGSDAGTAVLAAGAGLLLIGAGGVALGRRRTARQH